MQEQMKKQTIVNGINVDELLSTIDAIKEQPELAKFQFRASNKWVGGTNNRTTVNEFYGAGQEHARENPFVIEKDEPQILLGTDLGANPVEYALTALAGCLTTTLVCFAAAQGVELIEVESRFEGDADLRGFLGLDENTRMGCENIRATFHIKSDAPQEKIQELIELAQNRSGVFDMLANKVPISVKLES
jgi:uncharacterized OsmC-like protein